MQNIYMPLSVKVENITTESDDRTLRTFDVALVDPELPFDYLPGQFCQLSILGKGEAPFGIASSPTEGSILKFTVNRVGMVTTALHHLEEGEVIGLRGPLGNNYPVDSFRGQNVVVIGGGFAFTTLRSLVVYLSHQQNRDDYDRITVIYGARRPGLLLYREEISQWQERDDIELHLTIDTPVPGWKGKVGFVPAVLQEVAPDPRDSWAVVCGPPIMLEYTLPVLADLGFPDERIYTSLERRMKCGVGKCGRCNIGPKYVCVDGPVFSYAELKTLREKP
jgi:sulfhydrogenase subunit gamma (sulfur reductase)